MKSIVLLIMLLILHGYFFVPVCSAEDWQADFNDICGSTERTEIMTMEELDRMIDKCSRVKKEIEKTLVPEKKVFLFRLKKSCNFYRFMKEMRQ